MLSVPRPHHHSTTPRRRQGVKRYLPADKLLVYCNATGTEVLGAKLLNSSLSHMAIIAYYMWYTSIALTNAGVTAGAASCQI